MAAKMRMIQQEAARSSPRCPRQRHVVLSLGLLLILLGAAQPLVSGLSTTTVSVHGRARRLLQQRASAPLEPPPGERDGATFVGWTAEAPKLNGTGFSPAAAVLGRFIVAFGGVTTGELPAHSTQEFERRKELFRSAPGTMSPSEFVSNFTSRAINLYDFASGTVFQPRSFVNATADVSPVAKLAQPAVGAGSVVRVGSALYAFGLCNTIPSMVNMTPDLSSDLAAKERMRVVANYLLSVQQLTLHGAPASDAAPSLRVENWQLPPGTVLRYNATCVTGSQPSTSSSPVVYVVGGVDALTGETLSTVAQYDVAARTFTDAVWSLGHAVATPGAVAQSELVFFAGGFGPASARESSIRTTLSVFDVANGNLRRGVGTAPALPNGGDQMDGPAFPRDSPQNITEALSAMKRLGWTAPQLFVHGRAMLVTGTTGTGIDDFKHLLVWADMTRGGHDDDDDMNAKGNDAGDGAAGRRRVERRVSRALPPTPDPHGGSLFFRVHVPLAPQRRFPTLVSVPSKDKTKVFLLGGLVPSADGVDLSISSDIFSGTLTTEHPQSSSSVEVASLTGVQYTLPSDGTAAAAATEDVVLSASPSSQAYATLHYNRTFRVLLSSSLSALCPGIDGAQHDQGSSGSGSNSLAGYFSDPDASDSSARANASTCSVLLSLSPHCDAPVAVFHNIGRQNVSRRTVYQPVEKPRSPTAVLPPAARSEDATLRAVEVYSVGDVYLSGSHRTGLQHAFFSDNGGWAYHRFPAPPAETAGGDAAQVHLYVCLSTAQSTVAGCNVPDKVPVDGNNKDGNDRPRGGMRDGRDRSRDRRTRRSLAELVVRTPLLEEVDGAVQHAALPPLPPPFNDAPPVPPPDDDGDGSGGAFPPGEGDAGERRGEQSADGQRGAHRYHPRTFNGACASSFYVALNGDSPYLLSEYEAVQDDATRRNADGDEVSSAYFTACLSLLALAAFVALCVYRQRYKHDEDYLLKLCDCARPTGRGRATPLPRGEDDHEGRGARTWLNRLVARLSGRTVGPSVALLDDVDGADGTADRHSSGDEDQQQHKRGVGERELGVVLKNVGGAGAVEMSCAVDVSIPMQLSPPSAREQDAADSTAVPVSTQPLPPSRTNDSSRSDRTASAAVIAGADQSATSAVAVSRTESTTTHTEAGGTNAKKAKKSILDGKYKVLRRLGRGSFSVVYLVKRTADAKKFALKYVQCSDDLGRREAMKECEVVYALQGHPNVIELVDMFMSYKFDSHVRADRCGKRGTSSSVDDADENSDGVIMRRQDSAGDDSAGDDDDDGRGKPGGKKEKSKGRRSILDGERYLSLVMAYHEEGDLGRYVRERRLASERIAEPTIVSVAFQVLSALSFMHNRTPPIVHRDLKPENILLTARTECKDVGRAFLPVVLTDFGLSRVMDKTFCETGVGSLPYVAPECWQRHYSCKVDIWALGCILYAMMSRRAEADNVRVMFSDCSNADFHQRLLEEMTGQLGYSTRLAELVVYLLRVNPTARPTADDALKLFTTVRAEAGAQNLLSYFDDDVSPAPARKLPRKKTKKSVRGGDKCERDVEEEEEEDDEATQTSVQRTPRALTPALGVTAGGVRPSPVPVAEEPSSHRQPEDRASDPSADPSSTPAVVSSLGILPASTYTSAPQRTLVHAQLTPSPAANSILGDGVHGSAAAGAPLSTSTSELSTLGSRSVSACVNDPDKLVDASTLTALAASGVLDSRAAGSLSRLDVTGADEVRCGSVPSSTNTLPPSATIVSTLRGIDAGRGCNELMH